MSLSRREWLKSLTAAAGLATLASPAAQAREPKKVNPNDVGMLYDSTRCVGCRACITRCQEVNGLPDTIREMDGAAYNAPLDLSSSNKSIIKLFKDGGREAFVKRQCMHCADPACVSVCMAGALHKTDNGIVAYNKNVCVGCRYCQIACAFDVPKFTWNEAFPLIVKCDMCSDRKNGPACCEVCPRQALVYGKMSDLLTEARDRIEGAPESYNPKVYGEHDGGGTHALYLAAGDVSFDDLGLPKLPDSPVPQTSETIQHTLYKGFMAPAALFGLFTITQYYHLRNHPENAGGDEEDMP